MTSLEKKLSYTFTNKQLLQTALTHKTFAFEAETPIEYNERLEFLGDSILNFIIAEKFYQTNAYFTEENLLEEELLSSTTKSLQKKQNS